MVVRTSTAEKKPQIINVFDTPKCLDRRTLIIQRYPRVTATHRTVQISLDFRAWRNSLNRTGWNAYDGEKRFVEQLLQDHGCGYDPQFTVHC
jgi:O-methyltransferase involved in polyketide biosynthesis